MLFVAMTLVLVIRPYGLLGVAAASEPGSPMTTRRPFLARY